MLKKSMQKGFTIVELLIVIVVIGILAALVLNTFSGVQQRARDTERQTDINNLATQLEAYYNGDGNGTYPRADEFDTDAELTALFPGVDAGVISAPNDATPPSLQNTAATVADQYGYVALDSAGTACDGTDDCVSYTLSYFKEDGGAQTKASLNK
ncbi:MAG: type II secretion system protein [Candidatus Saccharimonadales bacterium]